MLEYDKKRREQDKDKPKPPPLPIKSPPRPERKKYIPSINLKPKPKPKPTPQITKISPEPIHVIYEEKPPIIEQGKIFTKRELQDEAKRAHIKIKELLYCPGMQ
jgi:hypothetical protein